MKFTVVLTIVRIDDTIFDCIESILNQRLDSYEIIICVPRSNINNINLLQNYIEKYKNITLLTSEDDNINKLKNKAIDLSTGKYIYFCDGMSLFKQNALEELYNNIEIFKSEILTFDCSYNPEKVSTMHEYSTEVVKQIDFTNKNRFINEGLYKGTEFYSKLKAKDLEIYDINMYVYSKSFLKKENIYFNEEFPNFCYTFILETLIKVNKIQYLSNSIKYIKVYKNIYKDNYYTRYNAIKYRFELLNKLKNIYFDCITIDLRICHNILDDMFKIIEGIVEQLKLNYDLDDMIKASKYIDDIKNMSQKQELIDIEIKSEILIDSPILYERTKNNLLNSYKNHYNDIYTVTNIINDIEKNKILSKDDRRVLEELLSSNKYFEKYKSYDNLKKYLNECSDVIIGDIDAIKDNLYILIQNIEFSINEKLNYYNFLEDKFKNILLNL